MLCQGAVLGWHLSSGKVSSEAFNNFYQYTYIAYLSRVKLRQIPYTP